MSLWSGLTPFSPSSPISLSRHHSSTQFLLAFSRSLAATVSTVALSCPQHCATRNTLTVLPAVLQPCSGLAAVSVEATHFGLGQTGARADGCHDQGMVPAPRQATASLRDHWLTSSAFPFVIIFETISYCQIRLKQVSHYKQCCWRNRQTGEQSVSMNITV